jgi:hypothetical protein
MINAASAIVTTTPEQATTQTLAEPRSACRSVMAHRPGTDRAPANVSLAAAEAPVITIQHPAR